MRKESNDREKKRLKSVKRNVQAFSFIGIFSAILMYLERVVFVAHMPIEYVGLYGLFQNIMNYLSIADFGIETALTYCLYEPLAHQKYNVVAAIMRYIKKFYVLLGSIIMLGGFICCWKINWFVRPEDMTEGIRIYFFLFLFSQASGYFITSRAVLLNADQKQYINIIASQGGTCIQMIVQMLIIVLTKNYFLYILAVVIVNLTKNLAVYGISTRNYNEVFSKKYKQEVVPKEISNRLKFNIGPMFLHKIGRVIISSTDTIILSILFGTAVVGRYNNYILLSNAFMTVFWLLARSITPSIGDVRVDAADDSMLELYDKILYGNFLLSMISGIVFTVIAQSFIRISFGAVNELSLAIVFSLGASLFLNSLRITNSTFRDALGLFSPDWYKPIIEAIFNIVVSYYLAIKMGPVGVIIGTVLTYFCISLWIETYVIVSVGFKNKLFRFIVKNLVYVIVYCVFVFIAYYLTTLYTICSNLVTLIVNAIVGLVVSVIGSLLLAIHNKSAKLALAQFVKIIRQKV